MSPLINYRAMRRAVTPFMTDTLEQPMTSAPTALLISAIAAAISVGGNPARVSHASRRAAKLSIWRAALYGMADEVYKPTTRLLQHVYLAGRIYREEVLDVMGSDARARLDAAIDLAFITGQVPEDADAGNA